AADYSQSRIAACPNRSRIYEHIEGSCIGLRVQGHCTSGAGEPAALPEDAETAYLKAHHGASGIDGVALRQGALRTRFPLLCSRAEYHRRDGQQIHWNHDAYDPLR